MQIRKLLMFDATETTIYRGRRVRSNHFRNWQKSTAVFSSMWSSKTCLGSIDFLMPKVQNLITFEAHHFLSTFPRFSVLF